MMKKEYIVPEMSIRKVQIEGIMDTLSMDNDEEGSFEGAHARKNSDWSDDEEYDNIWED